MRSFSTSSSYYDFWNLQFFHNLLLSLSAPLKISFHLLKLLLCQLNFAIKPISHDQPFSVTFVENFGGRSLMLEWDFT
jgi:hypothetical protein